MLAGRPSAPRVSWLLVVTALTSSVVAGCSKAPTGGEQTVKTSAPARRELLAVGSEAPLFTTTAHDGSKVELEKLRGKVIVLYFYPKDGTPGCTTEAQGFASGHASLERAGAVILGVSTDDSESHRQFAADHALPFLLIPDTERTLAEAYGVGGVLGMTARVTYIIDREGKIAKVYPSVQPKQHADEVLREIERLSR